VEEGVMGRTKDAIRRTFARWSVEDERASLDAAERRRLETYDDWLLYGPRLR
jgi:hypothetical protein